MKMTGKNSFLELPIATPLGEFTAHYSEKGLAGLDFPNAQRGRACESADLPPIYIGGYWLRQRPRRQRQQFIRTVADDNVVGVAAVQFRQLLAERLGRGARIPPQPSVHGRFDRCQHLR